MKTCLAFSLLLSLAIVSCKDRIVPSTPKNTEIAANQSPDAATDLTGLYTGDFGENKITVVIDKMDSGKALGKTITGSNERPFEGIVKNENGRVLVAANEAGSATSDGAFQFTFDPGNKGVISGNWKPYHTDAGIATKSFILNKKTFSYKPNVGDFPQASMKLLKDDDLNNLLQPELEQMRNEIFARHGYSFADRDLRAQFESRDWYIACSTNVTRVLTPIEKANLIRIKKFEGYAKQYGSDFGR